MDLDSGSVYGIPTIYCRERIYIFLPPILVFVTVLTIYLNKMVELFILSCKGASLLSFCTFIQFLIRIYYYYWLLFLHV